jgi:hypothetical protein
MNNTWEIEIASPLLRPGMTIRTKVSERYLVAAIKKGMDSVREVNLPPATGNTCENDAVQEPEKNHARI